MTRQESEEISMSATFPCKVRTSLLGSHKRNWPLIVLVPAFALMFVGGVDANNGARDPGVRSGPPGAGTPIAGLSAGQLAFFNAGLTNFGTIDSVSGTIPNTGNGLGPRYN